MHWIATGGRPLVIADAGQRKKMIPNKQIKTTRAGWVPKIQILGIVCVALLFVWFWANEWTVSYRLSLLISIPAAVLYLALEICQHLNSSQKPLNESRRFASSSHWKWFKRQTSGDLGGQQLREFLNNAKKRNQYRTDHYRM